MLQISGNRRSTAWINKILKLVVRVSRRKWIYITSACVCSTSERIRSADCLPPNTTVASFIFRLLTNALLLLRRQRSYYTRNNQISIVLKRKNKIVDKNAGIFEDWKNVGGWRWTIVWCQQSGRPC